MIMYLKRHFRGDLSVRAALLNVGLPWAVFYGAYWVYFRHITLKPYAPFRAMPVVVALGLCTVGWQAVGAFRSARREKNRTVSMISLTAIAAWFTYHFGMLALLGGLYLVSLR